MKVIAPLKKGPAAEQALAADSPLAGFFGKLRGRAAEARRSTASLFWVDVMLRIITGTIVVAALAVNLTRLFHIQKWVMSVYLLTLAFCLYLVNVVLIRYFISKRAPEFANDQMWEATAETGIVPKWVSSIGLFSISALIAAVVPWLIAFLKLVTT